jgi:3'-phosphoadenosine 5'-phosphosulfate sulfotransferase (PAPS reductase)/FAD synthetase
MLWFAILFRRLQMLTVSYFSAGVSSAVATKLMIGEIDRVMYTHIDDQHQDTMRFVRDCEAWFGKPVEVWQSPLKSVENACRFSGRIKNRQGGGANCTRHLKKNVRKEFEAQHRDALRIVWGMDWNEQNRCEGIARAMPHFRHVFPLVERKMTKEHAHEVLRASGIRRPAMYELGYHNNNCIGCVNGGMGYWNKVRVDFPKVFAARAAMERALNFPCIASDVWLDELDPERGRHEGPICDDCGIMCELMALPPSGGDGMANEKVEAPK